MRMKTMAEQLKHVAAVNELARGVYLFTCALEEAMMGFSVDASKVRAALDPVMPHLRRHDSDKTWAIKNHDFRAYAEHDGLSSHHVLHWYYKGMTPDGLIEHFFDGLAVALGNEVSPITWEKIAVFRQHIDWMLQTDRLWYRDDLSEQLKKGVPPRFTLDELKRSYNDFFTKQIGAKLILFTDLYLHSHVAD